MGGISAQQLGVFRFGGGGLALDRLWPAALPRLFVSRKVRNHLIEIGAPFDPCFFFLLFDATPLG
jgi:hypothetical protein